MPQTCHEERVSSLDLCKCYFEPRGDKGLEGYQKDSSYRHELIQQGFDKAYYRVWPNAESVPNYYECCSPRAFHKYFTAIVD
jgi:hypothetical protein